MEKIDTEDRGPAVDNVRVRLRLHESEFEAEGPDTLVRAHLAEFKNLLSPRPGGSSQAPRNASADPSLELMYQADPGLKSLTLRILPSTDRGVLRQVANTLLLALHGFQEALGLREVPVLTATQTIRQSGLVRVNRLSNAFLALQEEGLAMKIGRGKGTRYQLTAKGLAAAQELIHNTLRRAKLSSKPE